MSHDTRWLPSRHFVLVLVAVLLAVGVVGFAKLKSGRFPAEEVVVEDVVSPSVGRTPLAEADTDEDGLKDWEEVLWKTDPKNPDTDSDGTPDGEEVAAGRNPAVPGPDDAQYSTDDSTDNRSTNSNLTETEILSRSILASYIDAHQQGSSVNAETLVNRAIQQLLLQPQASTTHERYTLQDVTTANGNDATALRTYGNAVGKVFKGIASPENNEFLALAAFAESGNPDDTTLAPVALSYKTRAQALIAIPVPSQLIGAHLSLANALVATGDSLASFDTLQDNPLKTLIGLRDYNAASQQLQTALTTINDAFTNSGVVFRSDEPGIVLTLNIQ